MGAVVGASLVSRNIGASLPPACPVFPPQPPCPPCPATESFDIVLWASCFVLLSLLLNAPAIGPVMRLTGLSRIAPDRVRGRARAVAELQEFTAGCIADLKQQQDGEFLQGERLQDSQFALVVDFTPLLHAVCRMLTTLLWLPLT